MSFISRILPNRAPRPPLLLDEALVHSESDQSDHECVQAVVDFVNAAQEKALLKFDELPLAAAEIYEADRYLAQVNNGGHGQYWHNCGRLLSEAAPLVEGALRASKSKRHLKVFRHFVKEMRGKEPSADYETSLEASGHFSVLDDEFFRVEKSAPLAEAQAARIRALKDVVLLDRDALPGAFEALAEANPNHAARRDAADVARVDIWFSNPQIFSAGLALAQADTPDLFGRLSQGGQTIDVAGETGYLFTADTLSGQAIVIFSDAMCYIHEILAPDERDAPDDAYPMAQDGAGRRTASLAVAEAEAIHEIVLAKNMGVATQMLLVAASLDGAITHAGCLSTFESVRAEDEVAALLRVGDRLVMVVVDGERARLFSHDAAQMLAEISATEIVERAEALRKA